jgi:hypothetical protein
MTPELVVLGLRVLGAAALYGFLAYMGALMWRDLRQAGRESAPIPSACLVIRGDKGTAQAYPLVESNTLGRAADNTIGLQNERVSAHHARLNFEGGQWVLEDLGSTNGTRVNGVNVIQPLVVTYGDTIALGEVDLLLTPGDAGGAAPPAAEA